MRTFTSVQLARTSWLQAALLLGSALAASACGDASEVESEIEEAVDETNGDERNADEQAMEEAPEAVVPAGSQAFRDLIEDDFSGAYSDYLARSVGTEAVAAVLADEPFRIRRGTFLLSLYTDREFAPAFVRHGALTPRGEAVLDLMEQAPLHALDVDEYLTEAIVDGLDRSRGLDAVYDARPTVTLDAVSRIQALALFDDPTVASSEDVATAWFDALLNDPANADTFAVLRASHEVRAEIEHVVRGADALLEVAVVDSYLAYAFDQTQFNVAGLGDEASDTERNEEIGRRMRHTFDQIVAASTIEEARSRAAEVLPQFPQYLGLFSERQRYVEMVANGGWESIEPRHLEPGDEHPRVAELKRRLLAEGFYEGPIDNVFGETLTTAVRTYQQTHQMEVTGETSRDFWSSINTSAEYRLSQIELTMRRWRETRVGEDDYYIHVNIPDFHAEVWRNGERQLRYRIVVGNRDRQCNSRSGRYEYVNATPIQSAELTYVVLNPHWNIPPRILQEELYPSLLEDPTYFERIGVERIVNADGSVLVRQMPGERNPLGRVKFIFPNVHNTYMHDTNRRNYFNYDIRAFSHGCMRVHEPERLLETVLTNDNQWDESRVLDVWETGVETTISLDEPVPVHIEYFVVRVDDDGRANFLSDVYRLDRRILEPDAIDDRCTPETTPAPRYTLSDDGRVMVRAEDGTLIDPNAPIVDPLAPTGIGTPAVGGPGDDSEAATGGADPSLGDIGP